jgi:pimeloyl-ACP methyl ester carboxylesterase
MTALSLRAKRSNLAQTGGKAALMTNPTHPVSKTLRVNNLALHYLEWGKADAPPIVCVHGFTSSAEAFNALARHLQDRFHILALDVRGHGESAWSPAGAYQFADQASDLTAFARQLGLEKFVLIGTSMGGVIAMAYGAEHAERLSGLVINDIGPDVEAGSQRITGLVGSRPDDFATLEEAMAYRRAMSPILAARSAEDQHELALGVLRRGAGGKWVWKMDPAYIRQRVERGGRPRPPLWPALQALPCPTLVVWGTDSDVLSEAQAQRMVDVLPRGELVRVAGIGHAPTLVEPVVLTSLDRFLGGL